MGSIIQSFYIGYLDDLRFYNRVLTDAEILQLFYEGDW